MDHTLSEWIQLAGSGSLAQAAQRVQAETYGQAEEHVRDTMTRMWHEMTASARSGLDEGLRSVSGLTGGQAALLRRRLEAGASLAGPVLGRAEMYALATAECNACMGRIVAAPTAGACGILPGVLLAMTEGKERTEAQAVDGLFAAAAVGEAIASQSSISGAEGGCQAECGAAAAMAAAALCEMEGADAATCVHAAAFALMNLMGLVCDPVGGLVEVPCVYRNVGAVGIAFTAADMALAGIRCPVEPDEVILAMKEVGDALPSSLRETGEGGCAACPSVRARLKKQGL